MTTHLPAKSPASREGRSFRRLTIAAFLAVMFAPTAYAQAPAAAANVAAAPSPAALEEMVGRIALYPDDLVSIILPASTNPLQLVQADRYLEKRKKDPKLPLDDKWDDSVKSLLNYPDIVKMMSNDLDWTTDLGEAVVAEQGAVLEAVQVFRRRTEAAGNLKSDAKQTVVVEKEIIKIVPADPQVIYVPQYNPTTVIVTGGYSTWGYYPTPYPVYYYPYPPGAAFATGLIWGAAIGAAWNGGHYNSNWGGGGNNNISINNNNNININRPGGGGGNRPGDGAGNRPNRPGDGSGNRPNRPGDGAGNRPGDGGANRPGNGGGNRPGAGTPSQRPAGGSSQWKPNKQPGQVGGSIGRPSSGGGRVGDARPTTQPAGGGAFGSGSRPATGGGAYGGGSRPSAGGSVSRPSAGGSAYGGSRDYRGGAFGGGNASGRQTQMNSSRGAASRNSMSGGGRSARPSGGGGGARAGGGGGGARGGGGGGRGGRGGRR